MALKLAIVSDTHVRPPDGDDQLAFPGDADHNDRNRRVVELVAEGRPDLVVHLGDVVHPIPTLPSHGRALAEARAIFDDFGAPLVVVPGNHDVGDKRSSVSAPEQVAAGRRAFAETWGRPFHSFDRDGVHFAIVDGGLLGAETDEAREQRAWLAADLATAGRTFVFTHYPPFLDDPGEPEHYDNLDPHTRRWLLDQCVQHGVEAVVTGHVHRFFCNHHEGVALYTVPSTAFVRPAYAWLRPHPPTDPENGRDDPEHTGFAWLEIDAAGHRLRIVRPRTTGPSAAPMAPRRLGTWLRHPLGRAVEIPLGSLDALTRKRARDDAALLHVLGIGLSRVRVPLADLREPAVASRLRWLQEQGVAVLLFSGHAPDATDLAPRGAPGFADAEWELVLRDAELAAQRARAPADRAWAGHAVTLSRIGKPHDGRGYFSHFPKQGFDLFDRGWRDLADDPAVQRIAFRVDATDDVEAAVAARVAAASAAGLGATIHVELPEATEAVAHTDDRATAGVVVAADRAARAHPEAHVLVDGLYDYDRGYWCKNGLVDLTDRPRRAVHALFEADRAG